MKTHIIIHHSLTKDSGTVSWDAIRKYHKETLGWRDIGYHFGVEQVENEYAIFKGRHIKEVAAAVREDRMNHVGIHICMVGNFDEIEPPIKQWQLAQYLCAILCKMYSIPVSNIMGHRDFAHYKSCPGDMFNLNFFRNGVEQLLRGIAND